MVADTPITAIIRGARASSARISAMEAEVDLATVAALKKVQQVTRTSIRSGMRGRPRWDHRGQTSKGGGANLNLSPHHVTKTGGPGKLTGALASSIRKSRKPQPKGLGVYTAVVMAGGKGGPQNLYKGKVESKYPYFAPGVKKAEPKMAPVWNAAWAKATRTR